MGLQGKGNGNPKSPSTYPIRQAWPWRALTRIERVRELLRSTGLPIKQVTHRAGFHQVEYMTRLFRRMTGQTPGRYRRQSRG